MRGEVNTIIRIAPSYAEASARQARLDGPASPEHEPLASPRGKRGEPSARQGLRNAESKKKDGGERMKLCRMVKAAHKKQKRPHTQD